MGTRQKSAAKQKELLQKGIELLWERGYNNVSVRDIVQAASVPKGSFYFYFDSKEDFVSQAIEAYYQSSLSEIQLEGTALERLRKILEMRRDSMLGQACLRGCMMLNLSAEIGVTHAEIRELIRQRWDNVAQPVKDLVREAQENGEIHPEMSLEHLAEGIEMTWRGAVVTAKATQDPATLDRALDLIFNRIIH